MEQNNSSTEVERQGFTPIPDVILDELLPDLTGAELKVLMYIARRTYGFQKQADSISVSQMVEGIEKRDGTILDRGTGLTRRTVIRAIGGLRDRGLLWKARNYDKRRGDMANTYTLTLPQPCSKDKAGGECKNDTPRVQKIHPQKRVGQKRELTYSSTERVSVAATDISSRGCEETSQDSVADKDQARSAREFVAEIYAQTTPSGRSALDEVVKKTPERIYTNADTFGSQYKQLVAVEDLTLEEYEAVVVLVAKDLCSPQQALKSIRGETFTRGDTSPSPATKELVEGYTPPELTPGEFKSVRREIVNNPKSEASHHARRFWRGEKTLNQVVVKVLDAVNEELFDGKRDISTFGEDVEAILRDQKAYLDGLKSDSKKGEPRQPYRAKKKAV